MWQALEEAVSEATGEPFATVSSQTVTGGCINEAVCLTDGQRRFFVKFNRAADLPMFEAEAAGLAIIRDSGTLRAPAPICTGSSASRSWLVLEYIEFGTSSPHSSELLGEQLAAMHRISAATFGWQRDNTIGSTPQVNTPDKDWVRFFGNRRLGYQLALAQQRGAPADLIDRGQRLREVLPGFFDSYQPAPSLLHGDLWGGNWATDAGGAPVIFDPAVYFGDREADLAMTELFGGFDDRFYQSYGHAWTFDPGYRTRKVLYNLYHILNHYNLFGGGYARQARDMIESLIAEIS